MVLPSFDYCSRTHPFNTNTKEYNINDYIPYQGLYTDYMGYILRRWLDQIDL